MKVHTQKKHKSKNLQLDHLSQRNEQAHVNKPASSRSWLGLTVQSLGGPGLDSCERLRIFLSVMLVISHDIIIFRDLTNLQWRHQHSNGNGVYVRKTTLYALPHFCKSFFRPCSTTTWTKFLVFTRRKTDEAINFNPSIWARTRSPQINYVQPYFPTFK